MKKNYHLPIIIEHDADGYFASCPSLQGCYSQGATYEEVLANIEDAVKLHLEDRSENREEMQDPKSTSISMIEVAV